MIEKYKTMELHEFERSEKLLCDRRMYWVKIHLGPVEISEWKTTGRFRRLKDEIQVYNNVVCRRVINEIWGEWWIYFFTPSYDAKTRISYFLGRLMYTPKARLVNAYRTSIEGRWVDILERHPYMTEMCYVLARSYSLSQIMDAIKQVLKAQILESRLFCHLKKYTQEEKNKMFIEFEKILEELDYGLWPYIGFGYERRRQGIRFSNIQSSQHGY